MKTFMRYLIRSRTATALSRLSDYELHDIGITRGDIGNIARAAANNYGK